MPSAWREAVNTTFKVFSMTRPEIKPQSSGYQANALTDTPSAGCICSIATLLFFSCSYVHLSNNETNDFKSRELKSVHIDAEGQYLKLLLHKNHENKFNPFNQVSINPQIFIVFAVLSPNVLRVSASISAA